MRIKFYAFFIFTIFCFLSAIDSIHAQLPVQWGTYYGGTMGDRARSVVTDIYGNVYIGGSTDGGVNMRTPGTYPGNLGVGPENGFVAKFNSAGVRLWGALFSGEVNAIATDNNGDLYITGKTGSPIIGIDGGSFQQTYGGGANDAYLIKLNGGNGTKQWVTYFGGAGNDLGYAVKTDADNNVYIAGSTNSNTLATPGSHKATLPGISPNFGTNYFLAKFTSAGSRIWATYYGGTNDEVRDFAPVIALATDQENNVFICGRTENTDQIASSNGFSQFKKGISDAFLVKFNVTGVRQWGTYYGGFGDDKGSDITTDNEGNVYLTGYTQSTTDIATPGAYQENYIADGVPGSTFHDNMFLVKFNSSGFPEWGTYYKDRTAISNFNGAQNLVSRIAFDPAGFVCLGGARSVDPAAKNFTSFSLSLARFDHNTGKVNFDSTIGSNLATDFIGGIATDSSGNIFISGYTESEDSIATLSGHKPSYGQGGDAFLVKLKKADTAVYFKNLLAIKGFICVGDTFSVPYGVTYNFNPGNKFTVQLYDIFAATSYDIGEITSQSSGKIFCTIPATVPFGSNYKIRIIASDPADTTIENSLNISINRAITVTAIADRDTVCEGEPINLRAAVFPPGSYKYAWKGPDTFKFDVATPMIPKSPLAAAGSYVLKVTNEQGGCLMQDTVDVGVIARPLPPVASCDSPVCENDTLFLRAYSNTPGATYHWSGPNGFSEGTVMNELARYNVGLDATGVYRVAAFTGECPSADVFVSTTIKPMPRFSVSSNTPVCEDDTLRLFVASTGDSTYRWEGPRDYATDSTNPVIAPVPLIMSGDYRVYTYLDGCGAYATTPVRIKPKPKVKVTNNSPLFEGEDLKFLMQEELYPGASYFWTGPDSFKSPEREPIRTRASDSASGTYHIVTTLEGCTYTTLTTVIIYSRDNQYFKLYPSPNTGDFTVEGIVRYDQTMHFEVANSANQVIGRDFIETDNRSFKTEINMAGKLSHGQYYFRIWINGAWETIPFTIIY